MQKKQLITRVIQRASIQKCFRWMCSTTMLYHLCKFPAYFYPSTHPTSIWKRPQLHSANLKFKLTITKQLKVHYIKYSILMQTNVSRPALGLTQPPVQWVLGVLSLELKRGQGMMLTTHPPPTAEVEKEYELYLLSPQAPLWRVVGQL
jgi:hypothetical protein